MKDRRVVFDELKLTPEQIRSIEKIFIVACGSSYHVGMVGKYNLERLLRRPVETMLASEFRYCDPLVDETPWSSSSASPARRWTPWPPCARPRAWGPTSSPS